jgi:glycosyltransferase involved in cell wall biosynthesis
MILKNSVGIIIPAYNESNSISKVILESLHFGTVIVVNDGSNDKTKDISESSGAIVISHTINQGYDQSILTGLGEALRLGLKFAITIDADGQHNSKDLSLILKMFGEEDYDLVIGARKKPARFGEFLFNFYFKLKYNVHDILCGLKGYKLEKIKNINFNKKAENSVGTEIPLLLLRSNYKVGELPIEINLRIGKSKYGSLFQSNVLIILALFKVMRYDFLKFLIR